MAGYQFDVEPVSQTVIKQVNVSSLYKCDEKYVYFKCCACRVYTLISLSILIVYNADLRSQLLQDVVIVIHTSCLDFHRCGFGFTPQIVICNKMW